MDPQYFGHLAADRHLARRGMELPAVGDGWAPFAVEDMGRLGGYMASLFGGGGLFSAVDGYRLRTYLPTLAILAVGSTPLMKNLWDRLGERARSVLTPLLVLGALILCTASLVDAGYNPFLYFRF